jgi:hypothetical protein
MKDVKKYMNMHAGIYSSSSSAITLYLCATKRHNTDRREALTEPLVMTIVRISSATKEAMLTMM